MYITAQNLKAVCEWHISELKNSTNSVLADKKKKEFENV